MAYRDYNGQITIDEVAAKNDVRRINEAISKLEASKNSMNQLIQQSNEMKGATAQAIEAKASELKRQIEALINTLNQEAYAINQTVAKYKRLDQEVKLAIQRQQ